jgi:translocation and assembly module TamB
VERSVNKFVIFFFLVVTLIVYGAWEVMRSDYVASYISKKVSEALNKQENLIVSFEQLEVSPFSLGVSVKNVFFEAPKFGGSVDALELNLGFMNLFKSKFSLNEIVIIGGEVYYDYNIETEDDPEENSENPKKLKEFKPGQENYREKIDEIFQHEAFERFKKIKLINSRLNLKDREIRFNDFYIHNFREIKILAGTIRLQDDWLESKGLVLDGINFNATFSRNKFSISPLVLKSDIDQLTVKGEIIFNKKGIPIISGAIDSRISTNKLNLLYDLGFEGQIDARGSFGGNLKNLQAEVEVSSPHVTSKFYKLKQLYSKIVLNNKKVNIESLSARNGRGKILLNKKHHLYSFETKKLNLEKMKLQLINSHTRDLLFFLGDSLDIMDLVLDGDLELGYTGDHVFISVQEGFKLKRALLGEDGPDRILDIKGLNFSSGSIDVDVKRGETKILLQSGVSDFNVGIDGVIADDNTFFKVRGENVDLKYVGDVSGVNLQGKGVLDLEIVGREESVINMKVEMEDFGIVDFYFGESIGEASYNISTGFIDIKNLSSLINDSKTFISGNYDIENSSLLLKGRHEENDIRDIIKIFGNYMSVPENLKERLEGKLSTQYVIEGPVEIDKLQMKGFLKATLLSFDEVLFKEVTTDIDWKNGIIKIPNLSLGLFGGKLSTRYEYHINNNYQDIDFTLSGASISGVPYIPKFTNPIKGDINVEGFGSGRPEDFNLKIGVDVNNLNIANQLYKNNYVDFIWDVDNLLIDLDFFNSQMITKASLNFNEKSKQKSFVKSSANFESLNPFFYTINSNLKSRQSSLRSRFAANFEIVADLPNQMIERIDLNISDFYLRHYTNTLRLKRGKNQLIYRDGLVKKSQIQLIGRSKFINYELEKIDNLTFTNRFGVKIPLTFLELVVPNTEFNSGLLTGQVEYFSGLKNSFKEGKFQFEKLNFQPRGAPVTFKDFNGVLRLKDKDFLLEKAQGNIGRGKFQAEGFVSLKDVVPLVDLRFNLDNSLIIPFDNSKFLLSADGAIRGDQLPYLVDGKIVVYHSEINESIDKLTKQTGTNQGAGKSKYLPQLKINEQSKLVRTNFNIDFIKPLKITNDLFSLSLIGGGTILGDFDEIKFDGKFETLKEEENIVVIKGHRFAINEGVVLLKEDNSDSTLNVKGSTRIKNYDINLAVEGPLKKIAVSLSSEPALAKEDIFSLITFGYTTQTSQELDQADRDSVATVGIGSMIFDQLKIGQGLNSSLGLKMSIAPEFQTEEGSLMDGKSGTSTSRRLRSATRIKVEKSFSDKVDMSFSNTVGGTVQQKQQMNVIYKVNDNISVDGVLEVNDVQEESSESPESVGADLKFKWSF